MAGQQHKYKLNVSDQNVFIQVQKWTLKPWNSPGLSQLQMIATLSLDQSYLKDIHVSLQKNENNLSIYKIN